MTKPFAVPDALAEALRSGWGTPVAARAPESRHDHAGRRARLAEGASGPLLVPSGVPVRRGGAVEHPFRAASDYVYLTGDQQPGAVLLLDGSHATLFTPVPPRLTERAALSDASSPLWARIPAPAGELADALGVEVRPRAALADRLRALPGARVLRGVDAALDSLVEPPGDGAADAELAETLAELRLRKDADEVAELEEAVAITVRGFADVAAALPDAVARPRGERWLAAAFRRRAEVEGNGVGYPPIVGAGANATILHYEEADGPVRPGAAVLLDLGAETTGCYTADVTRVLPAGGVFTPEQGELVDVVAEAQQAALRLIRPGADPWEVFLAAQTVLAAWLVDAGVLAGPVEAIVHPDAQLQRRYTVHRISHQLGLDVHDCAALPDRGMDRPLEAGMVITVEPGLYLRPDDLTVPEPLRGLGVRIEDDVLVTPEGQRVLSEALPRRAAEVEAWLAGLASPSSSRR